MMMRHKGAAEANGEKNKEEQKYLKGLLGRLRGSQLINAKQTLGISWNSASITIFISTSIAIFKIPPLCPIVHGRVEATLEGLNFNSFAARCAFLAGT